MKPPSFRLRIALLSVVISGGVLLVFGASGWYLLRRERVAALDREIRSLAYRHPGWMGGRANFERLASTLEFVFGEDRKEELILLVTDATGEARFRSVHWPPGLGIASDDLQLADDPTPATGPRIPRRGPPWAGGGGGPGRGGSAPLPTFSKLPAFRWAQTDGVTWRLGIFGDGDDRFVIGIDCADLQRELVRIRAGFLVALPLALALIGSGGWWLAGRALRPLRSITRVAEGMTARGLDQRIAPSAEDPEIDRLIGVLNGMMDRLETSFRQATRFSADASHELKTPLAVMQGQLENALQAAPAGSREPEVFAELLEQTQRLKAITRTLLLLAQSDAGSLPLSRTRVDLAEELKTLLEDVETLAAGQGVRVEQDLGSALWVEVDWPLLRQAIGNVLQNAVRYNEANGWVRATLTSRDGCAVLEVSNGGRGIPEAEQPRIFGRFFRGDSARAQTAEGSGLGLSLAREIVRAHGGSLLLKESRPGQTSFVMSLPG